MTAVRWPSQDEKPRSSEPPLLRPVALPFAAPYLRELPWAHSTPSKWPPTAAETSSQQNQTGGAMRGTGERAAYAGRGNARDARLLRRAMIRRLEPHRRLHQRCQSTPGQHRRRNVLGRRDLRPLDSPSIRSSKNASSQSQPRHARAAKPRRAHLCFPNQPHAKVNASSRWRPAGGAHVRLK